MPKTILETERLILREMTPQDVGPLAEVLCDPEAMRYYPAPFTREKVGDWVSRSMDRCATLGFGLWAVVLKETGEVIGDCGLLVQQVLGREELEVGYHIVPRYQGRGFATEAARACVAWGFAHTSFDRVISLINVENAPSRSVAEKPHARFLGDCGLRADLPHCFYGTTRAEFDGQNLVSPDLL